MTERAKLTIEEADWIHRNLHDHFVSMVHPNDWPKPIVWMGCCTEPSLVARGHDPLKLSWQVDLNVDWTPLAEAIRTNDGSAMVDAVFVTMRHAMEDLTARLVKAWGGDRFVDREAKPEA